MQSKPARPDVLPSCRRRLLGALLALPALPWLGRLPAGYTREVFVAPGSDGFVVIDGWVLPARYFKD